MSRKTDVLSKLKATGVVAVIRIESKHPRRTCLLRQAHQLQ